MLALLVQTNALVLPSIKSHLRNLPAMPNTNTIKSVPGFATASVMPLITALPAVADDGGSGLDAIAPLLYGGIGIFLLIIGYFAVEAAKEVGSQAGERADRLGLNNKGGGGGAPGRRIETVYDDTDYTYKENQKAVENSRTRKKVSKQYGRDGKLLAPWQIIDEERVDKQRKARQENKKKTGKFFG